MGKGSLIHKSLAVSIIFLFILSSIVSIGLETKDNDNELETTLANLRYMYTDESGFSEENYEYYKQKYLNDYQKYDDRPQNIVEPIENKISNNLPIPLPTGLMNSSWPMKAHDLHHTGRSQYSPAEYPIEKWRFRCDNVESSAAIDDNGIIYCGERGSYFYALYPNGTLKWQYNTGGMVTSAPAIATDGTIYLSSWDECLHAINPNGTRKWKFDTGCNIASSPAIGEDGTIYFGTFEGPWIDAKIYALNPDGTEKWQYGTGYHVVSDPAIGDDGTIYIGSGDHYFYALYPNGTLRWRFPTGDIIKSHASIADDGTIYFSSFDGNLYALNPDGTLKWAYGRPGSGCNSVSIDEDGVIYLGGNTLYAIYPNNLTIKWSLNTGGSGHASPAISADGTIYVCNDEGKHLIAVNSDGTERWRYKLSNLYADCSPIIGEDGTIYVGSHSSSNNNWYGNIHAFGIPDPNAPLAPSITGEIKGEAGVEYDYTFSTIDPNEDDIFFNIEWGDGSTEDWFGPYDSGEEVVVSHNWSVEGNYTIKARAKDTDNLWGPWGELEVAMPVNQQSYSFPLLQRLFERFPNAFPILRNLLEL